MLNILGTNVGTSVERCREQMLNIVGTNEGQKTTNNGKQVVRDCNDKSMVISSQIVSLIAVTKLVGLQVIQSLGTL